MPRTKVTKKERQKQEGDRISGRQPPLTTFNVGELLMKWPDGPAARINIPIDKITHGTYQRRGDMSQKSVSDLAHSIAYQGLLAPITVRMVGQPNGVGGQLYEVIAGHRRLEACRLNQMEEIPCQVITAENEQAFRLGLEENIRRVDLSPLEEAASFKLAMETFGWDRKKLAFAINRSQDYVINRLELLDLPDDLKHHVVQGVPVSKVKAAAPLSQLGIEPKAEFFDQSTHDIEGEVLERLKRSAFPIEKRWDPDICLKAGCLGVGAENEPICLNLSHAISMRMKARQGDVDKAVEGFYKDGRAEKVRMLTPTYPVFFDLSELLSWGQELKTVPPGFPPPPGKVQRDSWSSGTCASWPHLTTVVGAAAVKRDCLACPAFKRKAKQGRGLLVRWVQSYSVGDHWEAEPICCVYQCRHEKGRTKESKSGSGGMNPNVVARHAVQPYIREQIAAMLAKLAKDPARSLALAMIARYRSTELPGLMPRLDGAAHDLGIKIPGHDKTANGILKALASVGVNGLLAICAHERVYNIDSIGRGYDTEAWITPQVFPATCALVFGEKYGEEVKAEISKQSRQARADFRAERDAKKEAKGGRKKAPAKAKKVASDSKRKRGKAAEPPPGRSDKVSGGDRATAPVEQETVEHACREHPLVETTEGVCPTCEAASDAASAE